MSNICINKIKLANNNHHNRNNLTSLETKMELNNLIKIKLNINNKNMRINQMFKIIRLQMNKMIHN